MKKTSNATAYIAWLVALAAILMPPAFTAAGATIATDARDAMLSLLEEPSDPLVVAQMTAAEADWIS